MFFGGKGGVGKTTCAAAHAVAAARSGRRVLVVSTDPAHSLSDALGIRLTSKPSRVRGVDGDTRLRRGWRRNLARAGSLAAVELDAPRAFARWLTDHRRALGDILEHGTWLDREDVEALLELSIPGIDELIGLIEIVRLATRGGDGRPEARAGHDADVGRGSSGAATGAAEPSAYDLVVIDTAPTGHTLRLLASPDTVAAVAGVFEAMQREHRLIREQLARVWRPEAADRLIGVLADHARDTGALLRDPRRSAFEWVLLPEELSLAESEDGVRALERAGIAIAGVIVNRATGAGPACPVCDRRRAEERRMLAEIRRRLGRGREVRIVKAQVHEPRGVAALARIGRELTSSNGARRSSRGVPVSARRAHSGARFASSAPGEGIPPESIHAFRGARLLFFGGKGGVGKTTCAAATSLGLARADPSRRTLLLSTDPAHSLGDVFGIEVGDRPMPIPGAPANLLVRELDSPAALAARRGDLEAALEEVFAFSAAGGDSAGAASRGVSELMELAPPGIDELLGMLSLLPSPATRESGGSDAAPAGRASRVAAPLGHDYDLIVVDTAPTGHALRLLEMPEVARKWVQLLMRVVLKYRAVVRPGKLAAELVNLSKSIHQLQTMLSDSTAARFIVVTRAADVPRLETERLIERLRRLKLAVPAIIVNAATLAPRTCPRCRATASEERAVVAALARSCRRPRRECAIILTPLAAPPPRGVAALDGWAAQWVAASRGSQVTNRSRRSQVSSET